MANLRIVSVVVVDSTNITAKFTENLDKNIGVSNIQITSQTPGVPDISILTVSVVLDTLNIITQPLTTLAAYFITFQSTNSILFKSLNSDSIIFNDGITNKQLIIGPIEATDPIKEYLTNFFRENVYDIDEPSNISKYIQGLSLILSKSLHDIKQVKNENYLSFTITDEQKTRSSGPFDRLNEEGAYEIMRVGKTRTEANASLVVPISLFPNYPVSLLSTANSENLTASSSSTTGTFNIDTLTLNVSKHPVIVLNSLIFIYNSILPPYTYNIANNGYQLLTSKYDPNSAFTFLQLSDNQIRLNEKILNDSAFSTENIASVAVSYQYKDLGRVIDPTSVIIDTVLSSGREVLPPIENIFALKHAPIVEASDIIGTVGDVSFINLSVPPESTQPNAAFQFEVQFRLDYLPSKPGEYSIDYNTGTVYVFGGNITRDGTGASPPLANYLYRFTFTPEIDYVYDPDTNDIVSLPNGNLLNSSANISFAFQEVLIQGTDYKANIHKETINERIENRLVALNAIEPLNFPITNVFRIFNETTGEIYRTIRWTDNKIFFQFSKAPNIVDIQGERASFQNILNELLFISGTSIASSVTNIFKIFLQNNNIIAETEDEIGSSFNTSVKFSDTTIFLQEIYFDNNLTEAQNNLRLQSIGEYQIDYVNGIVYVFVSSAQSLSVGTISYKRGYINPEHSHVITVDDIYYRFNVFSQKNKSFTYRSFDEGFILPTSFDVANETFLMGNTTLPYQILTGQVGAIVNAIFTPGITSQIKTIRALYEYQDLLNNIEPINFVSVSTSSGNNVSITPLLFNELHTVQFDGINFFITANTDLLYLSPNITLNIQIIRLSDSAPLWNGSGTIILGKPFKLLLPGINAPMAGDAIQLIYSFTINDLSRIIIDYNRGDYFIDYSYLADEILISYEYGDNVLDFRQSLALNAGDTYFVSYKAGALRDALLKNFGTLIDIPLLNNLDISLDRERYRDALVAAMQSFTQGPTVTSMKNIVRTIVHTPPEIIESAFQNWTLGNSLLVPESIATTGNFNLTPAKYDNGVIVDTPGQTITFPVVSNLRLEQGTFESWIIPEWNGIDNKSDIIINITKNGLLLNADQIFIGPGANHPQVNTNITLNTYTNIIGLPNKSKDGVFIYYAPDITNTFNRWYIDIIDGYADGYFDGYADGYTDGYSDGYLDGYEFKNYKITVKTDGKFYDVKSDVIPKPSTDKIFSGINSLTFTTNTSDFISTGITFVADKQHYLFDFAKDKDHNRFSLFKDESGYINFRVIDKNKVVYLVSANVSSWIPGQQHHIAASWILNSKIGKDEMHLFIDGLEVPNILKYKDKISPYLHEKYRTIDPEEVVDVIQKSIVASTDLSTTFGSNVVSSASINFTAYGILPGATIFIEEPGFSTLGYLVSVVNGNSLTLTTMMPFSTTNSSFSVNKTTFNVATEIDLYPNIAVSLLHSTVSGNDLTTNAGSNTVSSVSTNFTVQGVKSGYLIRIEDPSLAKHYTIVSVNGNTIIISDPLPVNHTGNAQFFIYPNIEQEIPGIRALYPAYTISRDISGNVSLTIRNKALVNDIILIRTLGVNNRRINKKYFVWSNISNILMTQISTPILLNDVKITHVILDTINIGSSNSTLIGNIFTSNNITTYQPSISSIGRTLSVYITSSNIDYSIPLLVSIHGTINGIPNSSETLIFTQNATINTINKFSEIDYITVSGKVINTTKNYLVIKIKEAFPITVLEGGNIVPIIKYSYQILTGNTLSGSGNIATDLNRFFSFKDIGNYLIISSPLSVVGQYQILSVSADHHSITVNNNFPSSFSGGIYQVLNVSNARSGLQNGFFTFEIAGIPGHPYTLVQGFYEFDYYTSLSIPIDITTLKAYVGTDFTGDNIFDGTIDELQILSNKLTDTRIGEIVANGQETITKDFNSIKVPKHSINTLTLLHFDNLPFINDADVYITAARNFIQSSFGVNDNFNKSIVITDTPMIIDNTGILNTKKEGSIEFWINPLFDIGNDPNIRYYFDATSMISEEIVSINNATIQIKGRTANILNIKTKVGDQSIDYFAGGKINNDMQTIFLNRPLPDQQTMVIVNYIPNGSNGDRLSIYKDRFGFINLDVIANGIDYQIRSPEFWTRNTWHRIKTQYRFNSGPGSDEIRLFIDGYERGNILLNSGMLFGQGQIAGTSFIGPNNIHSAITFNDTVNELFIGSDFSKSNGAFAMIDNLRISNIDRPLFMPFGESIDVNYSTNLNIILPVVEDLYTTLLLDFENLVKKNTDFAILKNKKTGFFDITINIFDEFDILKDNSNVKRVLETLISDLKPANSRTFIRYIN
jgi:hypothetical protein